MSTARLTKHLRLSIYSYLDYKTVASKMTLLSKKENNNVKKSAIAREGKVLEFNLRNEFMKHCILCDES